MPQFLIDQPMLLGNMGHVIGLWVSAFLTLAVLSYVFGDNPLFRVTQYLFAGIAAGYAAAIAWSHILQPRLVRLLEAPGEAWVYGVFFLLCLMLLGRAWRPVSGLANIPLAILIGSGTALVLGGVLTGTLVPQLAAAIVPLDPASYGGGLTGWAFALDAIFLLLCTVAVLAAFQYQRSGQGVARYWYRGVHALGRFGRLIMMVAFGAILAGAALTYINVLRQRMDFLLFDWLGSFLRLGQ